MVAQERHGAAVSGVPALPILRVTLEILLEKVGVALDHGAVLRQLAIMPQPFAVQRLLVLDMPIAPRRAGERIPTHSAKLQVVTDEVEPFEHRPLRRIVEALDAGLQEYAQREVDCATGDKKHSRPAAPGK